MLLLSVLLVLLVLLGGGALRRRRRRLARLLRLSRRLHCGPRAYPLVGHAHLFLGNGVRRMQMFQMFGREAIKNGGMTGLWLGSNYYVVAVDPLDIEVILKTALEKDNIVRFLKTLVGNGSLFAPVSIWQKRRKIVASIFRPKNVNSFVEIFARLSALMVEQMGARGAGRGAVSMWDYLSKYALDSVCETTLDVKLNALQNSDSPFLKSLGVCCNMLAARLVQPWLYPDSVYTKLPHYSHFVKHRDVIHNFVDKAIKSKREEIRDNVGAGAGIKSTSDTKSFLELLMRKGFFDQELHEETIVLVIAGTDTSATGVAFTSLMLSRHPEIQHKVYQELQEVLGESSDAVSLAQLPRLKYLEAVVRETLRLFPPVPVVVRTLDKDITLPSGVCLVEGCGVMVNVWATQRHPAYWGPDADRFRPERFIDTPLKHPCAFLAFSHGPRACIGYHYAILSMMTVFATLLRSYELRSADDKCDKHVNVAFDVMMKDADGYKVKLQKRNKVDDSATVHE